MGTPDALHAYQDDVSLVQDFMSQMRTLCAQLTANPFNTPAAEALLDLLLDHAPAADVALDRLMSTVVHGPPSSGAEPLKALTGHRHAAVNTAVVGTAA